MSGTAATPDGTTVASGGKNSASARIEAIDIAIVSFDAPWTWLSKGAKDLWRAPALSFGYGLLFSLGAVLLLLGLFQVGWQAIILVLAGGFMLLGPILAIGLYRLSADYEAGRKPTLAEVMAAPFNAKGQLLFLAAILAFAFFAWIRIAILLFMLFVGINAFPPPSEFVPMLLFTPHGLALLVVGTAVGALLAAIVFTISVVSVPLVLNVRVDAVTAIVTSVRAVAANWKVMALWAVLIAGFTAFGIATLFVGLIFVFPLIGHASWHAYRDLVVVKIAAASD